MARLGSRLLRSIAVLGALFVGAFVADVSPTSWQSKGSAISQAEAVVGRLQPRGALPALRGAPVGAPTGGTTINKFRNAKICAGGDERNGWLITR